MSIINSPSSPNTKVSRLEHEDFLGLLPVVERHAKVVFRQLPAARREEAVAEAVAAAFVSFAALKARGKDPARDFPSKMAIFAALRAGSGRQVGGGAGSTDVLSARAQRKHGFRVESLPGAMRRGHEELYGTVCGQRELDAYEDQLQDCRQWPVPDRAAFRIDFPDFLKSLSRRDRRLVGFLAQGNSGYEAAQEFGFSPGRVSQLRKRWCHAWNAMHGETAPA